jgi:hypothetical protein
MNGSVKVTASQPWDHEIKPLLEDHKHVSTSTDKFQEANKIGWNKLWAFIHNQVKVYIFVVYADWHVCGQVVKVVNFKTFATSPLLVRILQT